VLHIDPDLIAHAYASHRRFVYLSRQITPDLAARAMQLDLPGVYASKGYRRFYPESAIASNVVGFTGIDGRGQEGIERAANSQLSGVDGWRRALHNARGDIIASLAHSTPRDGADVRLALDSPIQYAAYHATGHRSALRRALGLGNRARRTHGRDPRHGELAKFRSEQPRSHQRLADAQPRRHRRVRTRSVMKPLTIALALQQGRITPDSIVTTDHGRIRLDGATIHDDADFGTLTVAGVIEKSVTWAPQKSR
jgi:cell division protein FtsI (penicillin-binding protein 3)